MYWNVLFSDIFNIVNVNVKICYLNFISKFDKIEYLFWII